MTLEQIVLMTATHVTQSDNDYIKMQLILDTRFLSIPDEEIIYLVVILTM